MIGTTAGVERGCGYREQSGAYLECALDPEGASIEHFLIDPPVVFEPDAKIGQELVERNGVVHIFDWIGATHYPFTADFVEEVSRYGMSRRISVNLDVDRLSARSRVLCVHPRARFQGVKEDPSETYANGPVPPQKRCAKWAQTRDESHIDFPEAACTSKWWWDAEPTDEHTRSFASFSYGPVYGAEMPDPEPAIFASFPVSNISVIEANDGSHTEIAERLVDKVPADANIPVITSPA